MTKNSNVRPDNTGTTKSAGNGNRTEAVTFANYEAMLDSQPVLEGNPLSRSLPVAYQSGRSMIQGMVDAFTHFDGADYPLNDYAERARATSLRTTLDRIPQGLASSYGYALAYANSSADALRDHLRTEEKDRDGIAGFDNKTQDLLERVWERDAQAASLLSIIQGCADAYQEHTGEQWKLRGPNSAAGLTKRTAEASKQVSTNAAAFLAARFAK